MKGKTATEKKYRLYAVSGKVTGFGKAVTTFSYDTVNAQNLPGGNTKTKVIHISSPVNLHAHIFITDKDQTEHVLNLTGFNVACSMGHTLKAAWAIKNGEERGPYIAVKNYTPGQAFFSDRLLNKLLAVPGFFPFAAGVIVFIPLLIIADWTIATGGGCIILLLTMVWRSWLSAQRISRFKILFNFDDI